MCFPMEDTLPCPSLHCGNLCTVLGCPCDLSWRGGHTPLRMVPARELSRRESVLVP